MPTSHTPARSRARSSLLAAALTAGLVLSAGPTASAAPDRAPVQTSAGTSVGTSAGASAGASARTSAASSSPAAKKRKHRLTRGEKILRVARRQAGDPYRWGGAGPGSFDCSGLTQFVYKRALGKRLPHSSSAQVARTKRVARKHARKGDLVFFTGRSGVYHVAIYAGRNRVWHAPYPGQVVHRERIWTRSVFFGRVR